MVISSSDISSYLRVSLVFLCIFTYCCASSHIFLYLWVFLYLSVISCCDFGVPWWCVTSFSTFLPCEQSNQHQLSSYFCVYPWYLCVSSHTVVYLLISLCIFGYFCISRHILLWFWSALILMVCGQFSCHHNFASLSLCVLCKGNKAISLSGALQWYSLPIEGSSIVSTVNVAKGNSFC